MKAILGRESVIYAVSRLAMFVNVLCRIVSTDYPNTLPGCRCQYRYSASAVMTHNELRSSAAGFELSKECNDVKLCGETSSDIT